MVSMRLMPAGPLRSAIANRGPVRQPAPEIPSVGGTSEPRGVDDADVRWMASDLGSDYAAADPLLNVVAA